MEPIVKDILGAQAEDFLGSPRFDDNEKSEWHIISTNQPDHIGDIMEYDGMELPPSGKAIALLNHDPFWTGGLPLGKVLEYRRVKEGEAEQLWQLTQYLPNLPDNIGMLTYEARKMKAFVDSSIQFMTDEMIPVREEDNGKPWYEWKGARYKRWKLVEAGPVLIGMNWFSGDMKAQPLVKSILRKVLDGLSPQEATQDTFLKIIPEQRLRVVAGDGPLIKIVN